MTVLIPIKLISSIDGVVLNGGTIATTGCPTNLEFTQSRHYKMDNSPKEYQQI